MVALINGFILIIDYPRLESAANAATILTFPLNLSLSSGRDNGNPRQVKCHFLHSNLIFITFGKNRDYDYGAAPIIPFYAS